MCPRGNKVESNSEYLLERQSVFKCFLQAGINRAAAERCFVTFQPYSCLSLYVSSNNVVAMRSNRSEIRPPWKSMVAAAHLALWLNDHWCWHRGRSSQKHKLEWTVMKREEKYQTTELPCSQQQLCICLGLKWLWMVTLNRSKCLDKAVCVKIRSYSKPSILFP